MKSHDLIVLHALRNDARLKHATLARRLHWPVSTTHERVKRCIKQHVTRSVALIDLAPLGYNHRTMWILRPCTPTAILSHPSINTLAKLHTGDYLLETVTRTPNEQETLSVFLRKHSTVTGMYPVIDQPCAEKFLATPDYLPAGARTAATLPADTQ